MWGATFGETASSPALAASSEASAEAPLLASARVESPAEVPLAASASTVQPLIIESPAEAPLRATSVDTNTNELSGIASWLTRLNSQISTTFQSTVPRLNTDALVPYFDELEVAARDATLARLAHLSDGFGQLAEDRDLDSLAASRQPEGLTDRLVVEDLVFELLGEEE